MRALPLLLLVLSLLLVLVARARGEARAAPPSEGRSPLLDDDPPLLDRDGIFECRRDADGRVYRVQCVDATHTCAIAPDAITNDRGHHGAALDRARSCVVAGPLDRAALEKGGFTIVPALADAPKGWARDAHGRVFQVTFDLRKRLWLGASWAPRRADDGDGTALDRVALDVGGLELFVGSGGTKHHVKLIHGTIEPAPLRVALTGATYAIHRRWDRPLLRVTTFFGRARRRDVDLNAGAWFEFLGFEVRRQDDRTLTLARLATGHLALDVWQAPDLSSWLRVRGGVGVERTIPEISDGELRITPGGALDYDAILDDAGLTRLTATAAYERAFPVATELTRDPIDRVRLEAAIERVVLAVNDQPITVRAALSATHRDDDTVDGWDLAALVGLRLSFWAPAR